MPKTALAALALLVATALASPAQEGGGLVSLETGDAAAGWEGVGRLDLGGRAFCTGALIAPDLVLTAAHCLFDRDTGQAFAAADIRFLAGMRNGRALAYRDVARAVAHPDYGSGTPGRPNRHDLALLHLTQPIRSPSLTPFETMADPGTGTEVSVVSYAFDRAEAPSLEEVCNVLGRQDGMIVMSCDVDFGSSGAPVFQITDGVARIVSVISAKADLDGQKVAIGAELGPTLDELQAALVQADAASTRFLAAGERSGGITFLRP